MDEFLYDSERELAKYNELGASVAVRNTQCKAIYQKNYRIDPWDSNAPQQLKDRLNKYLFNNNITHSYYRVWYLANINPKANAIWNQRHSSCVIL